MPARDNAQISGFVRARIGGGAADPSEIKALVDSPELQRIFEREPGRLAGGRGVPGIGRRVAADRIGEDAAPRRGRDAPAARPSRSRPARGARLRVALGLAPVCLAALILFFEAVREPSLVLQVFGTPSAADETSSRQDTASRQDMASRQDTATGTKSLQAMASVKGGDAGASPGGTAAAPGKAAEAPVAPKAGPAGAPTKTRADVAAATGREIGGDKAAIDLAKPAGQFVPDGDRGLDTSAPAASRGALADALTADALTADALTAEDLTAEDLTAENATAENPADHAVAVAMADSALDAGVLAAVAVGNETPGGDSMTRVRAARQLAGAPYPDPRAAAQSAPMDPAEAAAAEAALGLSRSDRREVQRRLRLAAFDPQAIDGIFGPVTRDAIAAWQGAAGLPATGHVDAPTMALLVAQTDDDYSAWRAAERARAQQREQKRIESAVAASSVQPWPSAPPARACSRTPSGETAFGKDVRCNVRAFGENFRRDVQDLKTSLGDLFR